MKKLTALILALMLVLGLATSAFADEAATPAAKTYSITINNSAAGYTYDVYQIFTGDLKEPNAEDPADHQTANVLSNVTWGTSVTAYNNAAVSGDASAVADTLTASNLDQFLAALTLGSAHTSVSTQTEGKYVISGLEPGYYLIKNSAVAVDGSYTEYIVEVVENSTVNPKGNAPTVVKKVKDTNDSTGTTSDWQDSADHDLGDDVPFQLTATLADNVSAYDTYKVIFHDTLSAGLSYNHDAVVKVGGNTVFNEKDTSQNKPGVSVAYSGTSLTVTITDVTAHGGTDSSVVTVEYTAELNETAVIGSAGNPNTVKLEFSNNPYDDDNTGETPDDKVIVFTYKVIVNKVDKDNNALEGAGFTLYKKNDGSYELVEAIATGIGAGKNVFSFEGLDDGDYKLVESTTPAGYNTIADIEFTVSAEHATDSDNPTLTSLTGEETTGEITFTPDITAASLSTDVINRSGTTLPETGGMGTTLFYVVGGILVAAAAVLLVTKKRMAN